MSATVTPAWYHEPMELWLLLNWLRSKADPSVQDVDGVISIIEKPWHWNAEHEQMRLELAAAQESELS